jgi:hypothetical protein
VVSSQWVFLHAFIQSKGFKLFDSSRSEMLDIVGFITLLIVQLEGIM